MGKLYAIPNQGPKGTAQVHSMNDTMAQSGVGTNVAITNPQYVQPPRQWKTLLSNPSYLINQSFIFWNSCPLFDMIETFIQDSTFDQILWAA